MLSYTDLPQGLRDRIARIQSWIPAVRARVKVLVVGEEPPPPPVEPRGRRAVAPKPAPPVKEPPLSIRRLLIGLEAVVLAGACWNLGSGLHALLGGWPSRADFIPPKVHGFPAVRIIAPRGRILWVSGAEQTTLVRLGGHRGDFERVRGLPGPIVTAILAQKEGAWIGTTKGLAFHNGRRARRVSGTGAPRAAHITALSQDDRGRVWVGTAKDGLYRHDGRAWQQYKSEIANPYVTSLAPADRGRVWIGLFTGSIARTDGSSWSRLREAGRQRGSPIRRIVPLGGDRVVALTERGLLLAEGESWKRISVPGTPRSATVWDVAPLPRGRLVALMEGGDAIVFAPDRPKAGQRAAVQVRATSVATDGEVIMLGDGTRIYRALPGRVEPLTDYGEFFEPTAWFPPAAECPADWSDPRYAAQGAKLALGVLLLATGLLVRATRWRRTGPAHAWRIPPLRRAGIGLGILAVLFLVQRIRIGGRPVVASTINELALPAVAALIALWCLVHWFRMIRYEWKDRADAFWTGVALTGSVTGAWLWWVHGALIPSLIVCAVTGLTFGRGLRALRRGTLTGAPLAWATGALVLQQAALLPPLVFAATTWLSAALHMPPNYPAAEGLTAMPERLEWSADGLRAVYTTPRPDGALVALVDGHEGWRPKTHRVAASTVWPRPSSEADAVAVSFAQGGDTAVELLDREAKPRWRSRIPGRPVPGRQPCWEPGGESMLLLTYVGDGTQVWRVRVRKGDAVKVVKVAHRLGWPELSGNGRRMVCAVMGGTPGLAVIDLPESRTTLLAPEPPKSAPFLVWEPGPEGRAIVGFLRGSKAALRQGLGRLRDALQTTATFLGWRATVPELWIHRTPKPPKPPEPGFRWTDYDAVREVRISVDGQSVACILRRADSGTDLLALMEADGSGLLLVHRSEGHLKDLTWGIYKNRLAFIEETMSMLAPFPVRQLMIAEGLPERSEVRSFIPFTHWVDAPAFSPDGMRLTYAAPDHFWKISLAKTDTFGVFDLMLESEIGVLPPPAARQEAAPEAPKGGH